MKMSQKDLDSSENEAESSEKQPEKSEKNSDIYRLIEGYLLVNNDTTDETSKEQPVFNSPVVQ